MLRLPEAEEIQDLIEDGAREAVGGGLCAGPGMRVGDGLADLGAAAELT